MIDLSSHSLRRVFLPRLLGLLLVTVVATGWIIHQRDRALLQEIIADERALVAMEGQTVRTSISGAVGDGVFLSELVLQNSHREENLEEFLSSTAREFLAFLQSRTVFDQVALLSPEGMEEVSVEREAGGLFIATTEALRDHGPHEHLRGALEEPGLTWISPTDPEVAGDDEDPWDTLELFLNRALADGSGESILLRLSLRKFVLDLGGGFSGRRGQILLATRGGHWLLPPTGLCGEGADPLGECLPDLHSAVGSTSEGRLVLDRGLFSFEVIGLGRGEGASLDPGTQTRAREDWVLMTWVPREELSAPARVPIVAASLLVFLVLSLLLFGLQQARMEREDAQKRIREREEFLTAATEAVRDGLIVVNGGGEITFWNPGASQIFQYDAEEVLGKQLHAIITPPELRSRAAQGLSGFSSTGEGAAIGQILELPGLRRSGERFPAELSVSSFRMGDRHMAVGLVRDITERVSARERLALSDRILSAIGDLVLVADSRGNIVYASPSVEAVLGYSSEEVLGDGWWRLTRPEDPESGQSDKRETAGRAGSPQASSAEVYDRWIRHRDGSHRWIRWREFSGPDSTLVGVGSDVTERKEAEEARQRLAALIDHTSDFIGYAGLDGQCQFVNRGGLDMVGLDDPASACQNSMFDFIYPGDLETFRDEILAAVMKGESWDGEFHFQHHGGKDPIPVQGAIFPVMDLETGEPMAIGGTFKDIQVRKELEEGLLDAVRRAESASQAKERFLANMSHEIRTPMNAIMGMADLLWETPLSPEQRDYVQVFRSAGDTLLALINDVLDLAKVEEGHLDLEEVGLDVRELVETTVQTFAALAHGKGLEIGARVAPGVPLWVLGDPGRTRQILSNLVGNAVKFTERGQVLVEVTPMEEEGRAPERPSDTDGELALLKFTVSDSGVGIPPEKLQEIFGRFTQADASTTRRFGGSGLGLTISERLVDIMGGRIWVESEPGQGSSFHVALWLPVTDPPPASSEEVVDLRGVRVLVVDDNSINRLILREILSTWGAHVAEAPGGVPALDLLREGGRAGHPVRICLLDAEMPGMDGYQLAASIGEDPTLGDPLSFILTSHGEGKSRKEAGALGLSGHLIKPVRRATLLHALTSALSDQHSGHDVKPETKGREEPDSGDPAPAEQAEGAVDPAPGTPPRILVVDDSADNRMLLGVYLKKTGYQIEFAENGKEALEACTDGERFDLALMDIQMPVMDGYEATAAIRLRERESGTEPMKIVALSAHAMQEEIRRSLDAGCDSHLTKPIKKKDLLAAIEEILQGCSEGEMPLG